MPDQTFLLLGGAGLVGLQIARRIAHDLEPQRIVIASLYREEVNEAINGPAGLKRMFADRQIEFVGEWGDVFVRDEFADKKRGFLLESYERREQLFDDLHGSLDDAYERSKLVQLIHAYRPDIIIDAINTATAISYQDIYTASVVGKRTIDALLGHLRESEFDAARGMWKETERAFETLLLSVSVPQLIRHVLLVNRAMRETGTRLYLKIGTTGTGGMGLDIPYTHSEDRPSAQLMTKTAIAFAHTGLLFLMARTHGGPIVKELKPGAMIGYADVSYRTIRERGQPVRLFGNQATRLEGSLPLRLDPDQFESFGDFDVPVVDTGENGLFTKGEFEAITSMRQMEFITPEEIALAVVLEIRGKNTGHDVVTAIDSAVMDPTYRAGILRQRALDDLHRLEIETNSHSVALGQLGPPELSKMLWEAELLRITCGTLDSVLAESPDSLAALTYARVQSDDKVCNMITSIGVPILTPDGCELIRGPFIRIPEVPGQSTVAIGDGDVDRWATKGWVDLRPQNFARWRLRFDLMERARQKIRMRGSAAVTREAYLSNEIHIGEIVGWILNNELEGYRIK